MALLYREDPFYDENKRQTGFLRYRQLLSNRAGRWWTVGLLTLLGLAPLAAGIWYAVAASSVVVLIPCSAFGGMIAGPFLAGLYDCVLRGLRDDPLPWWDCWKRSWRQNTRDSLTLGAVMGALTGVYSFMGMLLFWWAEVLPGAGTVCLYLFGLLLILVTNSLLWPQLILFRQKTSIRLRNALLFTIKYFWRVMGVGLLQLAYGASIVLFAPWTLLLLPVTGVWYIVFVSQFLLYEQMNEVFRIEEQYGSPRAAAPEADAGETDVAPS